MVEVVGRAKLDFDTQARQVLACVGLTKEQHFWLTRELRLIQQDLKKPPSTNAVRQHVKDLRAALQNASKQVEDMRSASLRQQRDSAAGAAFNHLSLAVHTMDRKRALGELNDAEHATQADINLQVLLRLALATCEQALATEVPAKQRLRQSGSDAIRRIVDALARPHDLKSREVAARLKASRSSEPFVRVCEAVYEAVGVKGGVDNAIKNYLRQEKAKTGG